MTTTDQQPLQPGERLRAGSSVHRTIYIHSGDDPKGRLVGLMDTPELAAFVVEAVNARLDQQQNQHEG